jgi:hypothetical protein
MASSAGSKICRCDDALPAELDDRAQDAGTLLAIAVRPAPIGRAGREPRHRDSPSVRMDDG